MYDHGWKNKILQLKVYDPWILKLYAHYMMIVKLYAHYMMIFRVRSFSLHSNNPIVSAFLYEISKSLRIVQYTSKYKIVCFQPRMISVKIVYFQLGSYALQDGVLYFSPKSFRDRILYGKVFTTQSKQYNNETYGPEIFI